MPRVVPDQKNKYETDELFKKLSQDVDVSKKRRRQYSTALKLPLQVSCNIRIIIAT